MLILKLKDIILLHILVPKKANSESIIYVCLWFTQSVCELQVGNCYHFICKGLLSTISAIWL